MKISVFVIGLLAAVNADLNSYEGYKVYRLQPAGRMQLEILANLENHSVLDFWSPVRYDGAPVDVMVNPQLQNWFVDLLNRNLIKYEILINDVQKIVLQERSQQLSGRKLRLGEVDFTRYLRHNEINAYLDRLAQEYSNLVSVETAGKSYEGRDLKVIKISKNPNANQPIIFIDAGIHAREWIAPPVALYAINQLVENADNYGLSENVDWHILPVVNPDGYEYTHTDYRFWRKTRKSGNICKGTDGNRNYDYHWAEVGSSNNECSDIYHGKHAFSESETVAVKNHVLQNKDRIRLYLSLHSYGQLLVYPWSYTTELPEDHEELQSVGILAAEAIRSVAGTRYRVGASTSLLSETAGSSDDWVKGAGGVNLTYTVELPGGGSGGFNPSPERILPVVIETWEGLKAFHKYIEKKFMYIN